MKTLFLLLPIILLSGCMTTKEHVINGEKMYEVSCNGLARSYIDCQTEASKKCAETGQHYEAITRDGQMAYIATSSQLTPITNRALLYRCISPQVGY